MVYNEPVTFFDMFKKESFTVIERVFHLKEHGTTVKTEILAGLTTFLSMAYILAVNPSILGTVMNSNGVFLATAITSAIATMIMGFM